jgi:putative membrane protein
MKKQIIVKLVVLLILLLTAVLSCISPLYPEEMFLQHIGTLLLVIILAIDIRKNFLWLSSFMGIAAFTLLHIIAARHVYSFVPYDQWSLSLFGFSVNDYFGFERNQFDRFVHFAFGILIFPYTFQVFSKWKLTKPQTIFVVWAVIQGFSMFYELFEWTLTLVMTSEAAENYNGQQGDVWDAHKDMALAMFGSSIMCVVSALKKSDKKAIK